MKQWVFCAVLLLVFPSCTVLEDRVPCPCYLDIDYREVLQSPWPDGWGGCVDVTLFAPPPVWTENRRMEACPEVEEVAVEKAQIRVVGLVHNRPMRDFLAGGTQIRYEAGNQIDSLYVHTEAVDCTGEEARSVLRPHKQFSTLFFTDEADGDWCRRYNLVIRGTTCGLDTEDFSALDGDYLYTIQEDDGTGRISVYLFAAGYDPDALDLSDYEIHIDFRQALLYLRVADWTETRVFALYDMKKP